MFNKSAIVAMAAAIFFTQSAEADSRQTRPRAFLQTSQALNVLELDEFEIGPIGPSESFGTLTRESNQLVFNGAFQDLSVTENPYSVWWIVFNSPARCTTPCSGDDIATGIGQAFFAGAFIADEEGRGNVNALLPVGAIPSGAFRASDAGLANPRFETGLRRALDAQISVVIRRHGDLSGEAASVADLFGGAGCDAQFPNGPTASLQPCDDELLIVFPPAR